MNTITKMRNLPEIEYDFTIKRPSFGVKFMQFGLKLLSTISTNLSLKILKKLFFTPTKKDTRDEVKEYYQTGTSSYVIFEDENIFKFEKGDGPTVLFVHGWGSYTYRFRFIIDELVDHGYNVVAYDLPAHGNSSGKTTNILKIKNFLNKISEDHNIYAVVSHSFGATVSVLALSEQLSTQRLVTLGMPSNSRIFVEYFATMMDLSDSLKNKLFDAIKSEINSSYENISPLTKDLDSNLDILMFHDQEDEVIPIEESYRFYEENSNIDLIKTTGLGHRNILYDDKVKEEIRQFLTN